MAAERDLVLTMPPRGAGGGGGHTPVEAPDSAPSVQTGAVIDLWGEGPVRGLVNGLQSLYFDGVPVENADGSRNVPGFTAVIQLGTPADEGTLAEHGFDTAESEVTVGVEVKQNVPVVRAIADDTVDAVRVTIQVPQLTKAEDNGDLNGASFEWAIDVQSNGGGYVQAYTATVKEKYTSAYQKAVRIELRRFGPAPWNVRLRRLTPDSTDSKLQNKFYWASFTRITQVRMAFRHSAAAGFMFDARGYSAVPNRRADLMGFCEWEVPANYNPITRAYSGTWNGTFKLDWTNNPAWVYYGLITNTRWGLGQYIQGLPRPDKWQLYALAQWCDQLVSDGRGGQEPRYQMNTVLTTQVEAVKLLQDVAAIFRGFVLYSAGAVGVAWDQPGDPVAIYAPANVVGQQFNYHDGSRSAKKSACTVYFNDLSQLGERVSITWADPDLVAKYGLRRMTLDPIGCTSPSQALRHAKWALYTTEYEDQGVSFTIGQEGQLGRLGEVFMITDPSEAGERLGGRLRTGSTASSLLLDSSVELLGTETYKLWCLQPDPADSNRLVADVRPVTSGAGVRDALSVSPPFSTAPQAESMWVLEADTVVPTLWRYVDIEEVEGPDGQPQFQVVGIRHEPGKFDLVENGQPLQPRPITRLPDGAAKPMNLQLQEVVSHDGQTFSSTLVASWEPAGPGLVYLVAWRYANGAWVRLSETRGSTVDVPNLRAGVVEVQVRAQDAKGRQSEPLSDDITLVGSQFAAADVANLVMVNTDKGVVATWSPSPDFDYTATELRWDGANPDAGTPLAELAASHFTVGWPDPGTHTLWARHKRRGGPPGAWTYTQIAYTGPQPLLDRLDGLITEDQLNAGLNDRLDLIDGDGPGSVNERIAGFGSVGPNIVPASGFDVDSNTDGLADGWSLLVLGGGDGGRTHAVSLVDPLAGGGKAQRLAITGATNGNASALRSAAAFTLQAGIAYALSGTLRTAYTGVTLRLLVFNAGGGQVGDFAAPELPADSAPHRVQVAFTAPAGAASARIYVQGINASGEWLEVDAVQCQTGEFAGPYMPSPEDLAALSTTVATEVAQRTTADSAFATQMSAVQAQVGANSAAITAEQTARANADSALASTVDVVSARLNAKGANMLPNSSFELDGDGDGMADGWIRYAAGNTGTLTAVAANPRLTGRAQRVSATALGNTANDRNGFYRDVPIRAASLAQQMSSVWVRGTTGTTGRLFVLARQGTTALTSWSETLTLGGTWQRLYWSGVASIPALADNLRFYVWQQDGTGGGCFMDVDDAMMEPGTALNDYSPGLGDAGSAYAAITEERLARIDETGELSAQWSVKVDANGRWAGIVTRAGGNASTIDLLADVLRVGSTSLANQSLFAVYTSPTVVNGITLPAGVYLRDAFFGTLNGNRIIARSIKTDQLEIGSATATASARVVNLVASLSFGAVTSNQYHNLGCAITKAVADSDVAAGASGYVQITCAAGITPGDYDIDLQCYIGYWDGTTINLGAFITTGSDWCFKGSQYMAPGRVIKLPFAFDNYEADVAYTGPLHTKLVIGRFVCSTLAGVPTTLASELRFVVDARVQEFKV